MEPLDGKCRKEYTSEINRTRKQQKCLHLIPESSYGPEGRGFESLTARQLRNSHHRSVSGFAENCTLVGISSLSTATRFAGLAAEGERGNARGRKNDFDHLLQDPEEIG